MLHKQAKEIMSENHASVDQAPLLSPSFVWRVTGAIILLCLLTLAISLAGRFYGQSMSLVGHTSDTDILEFIVGQNTIRLPANTIRFESERSPGIQKSLNTYFTWPDMKGYSEETRATFNQTEGKSRLIFAHLAPAAMSADMSARVEPIYSRLIEGSPVAGPAGLVSYRMRPNTGYANELLYMEKGGGPPPYAVRCLIEGKTANGFKTQTGCQRDIAIGQDLSLTYRFSIELLPQWQAIETAIRTRFEEALQPVDQASRWVQ